MKKNRFVSRRRRRALKFNEAVMVAGVIDMKDFKVSVCGVLVQNKKCWS